MKTVLRLIKSTFPAFFTCQFQEIPKFTFSRYESIKLPLKQKFESVTVDTELAEQLQPVEVRPGLALATITGNLEVKNNK